MFELYHSAHATNMLKPQTRTTATGFGNAVDLQGYNGANIITTFGTAAEATMTGTSVSVRLYESADNSTYSIVAAADLLGETADTATGEIVLMDAFSKDDKSYVNSYIGAKRYIKPYIVLTGTVGTGFPMSIVCLRSHKIHQPQA